MDVCLSDNDSSASEYGTAASEYLPSEGSRSSRSSTPRPSQLTSGQTTFLENKNEGLEDENGMDEDNDSQARKGSNDMASPAQVAAALQSAQEMDENIEPLAVGKSSAPVVGKHINSIQGLQGPAISNPRERQDTRPQPIARLAQNHGNFRFFVDQPPEHSYPQSSYPNPVGDNLLHHPPQTSRRQGQLFLHHSQHPSMMPMSPVPLRGTFPMHPGGYPTQMHSAGYSHMMPGAYPTQMHPGGFTGPMHSPLMVASMYPQPTDPIHSQQQYLSRLHSPDVGRQSPASSENGKRRMFHPEPNSALMGAPEQVGDQPKVSHLFSLVSIGLMKLSSRRRRREGLV